MTLQTIFGNRKHTEISEDLSHGGCKSIALQAKLAIINNTNLNNNHNQKNKQLPLVD